MRDNAQVPVGRFDVVAIAASAGGIAALQALLSGLPPELPTTIVIVQHLEPTHPSLLAEILGRHTGIRVKQAENGERVRAGVAYVAPPGHHLLVTRGRRLSLTETARVQFARPSADELLISVASVYGERALAVILTGSGSDGAMGVRAIKERQGYVLAQDPESAAFRGMPQAAIKTECVDEVVPLEDLADRILAAVGDANGR